MNTFFDKTIQDQFRQRLEKLEQNTRNKWGKMSAAQMLAHCTTAISVTVGDVQIKPHPLRFLGKFVKRKMLQDKPFGKNSPTAPEFVVRNQPDFDSEKQRFIAIFERLAEGPPAVKCFQHPFFGSMTTDDWGCLVYKHLDHHFRQFGV